MLPSINTCSLYEMSTMKTDTFWCKIYKNEKIKCKNLANFVLGVLSLPHSNADCERIFSEVNIMKTKKINKLITETINGALITRQYLRNEGNYTKFKQVPDEMIKMMKSKDKYLLNKQESDVLETVNDLYGEVDVDGRLLR